jgi:hypothetical protein
LAKSESFAEPEFVLGGTYESEVITPQNARLWSWSAITSNSDSRNGNGRDRDIPSGSDLLSYSIRDLLTLYSAHWTINTRLRGDHATHEWIHLVRIQPWLLTIIDLQRQSIIKSSSSTPGVGFNTYIHCAIDRGIKLLSQIEEFAQYKSLRIRARSNVHLASPEQEFLISHIKITIRITLPRDRDYAIPISQTLGKELGGFSEDSPLTSNDMWVMCIALGLRDEIGVHRDSIKAIDKFVDEVKRQLRFKMTGLEPMVVALEGLGETSKSGDDPDDPELPPNEYDM